MINVKLSDLDVLPEEKADKSKPVIFIDSAVLRNQGGSNELALAVRTEKAVYPFRVYYQQDLKYLATKPEEEITIPGFVLGHDKDLMVEYNDLAFMVPITVLDKFLAAHSDLVIDIKPSLQDIIDYYAMNALLPRPFMSCLSSEIELSFLR